MTIVHRIMFHSRAGKEERSSSAPTSPPVAWATSPNVLACSAALVPHRFNLDDRPLCSDRKGPFDHLHYRNLGKSVSALYLSVRPWVTPAWRSSNSTLLPTTWSLFGRPRSSLTLYFCSSSLYPSLRRSGLSQSRRVQ